MSKFTNPLDTIRVASPCSANWDEMFGDDRKRFCAACKLNVYNLSDMTRREAENLLISSEGRLCVRYYRRADGTVLTADCPVGWQAVKRRVSRVATAAFSMAAGLFGGVFAFGFLETRPMTGLRQGGIAVELPLEQPRTMPKVGEVKGVAQIPPAGPHEQFVAGEVDFSRDVTPVYQIRQRPKSK